MTRGRAFDRWICTACECPESRGCPLVHVLCFRAAIVAREIPVVGGGEFLTGRAVRGARWVHSEHAEKRNTNTEWNTRG